MTFTLAACLHLLVIWFFFRQVKLFDHWHTFARCVYSASRGWPDCSRLSRIRVKGEDASLWLRSLEIKRMLCVRRCWIVDGAMVDGVRSQSGGRGR